MSNKNDSMMHLNGNLLAVIDTETTGTDPSKHDIYQICILLLDYDIKPRRDEIPFVMEMRPRRPENIDLSAIGISKTDFFQLMSRASDPYDVADFLDDWFEKLKRPTDKRGPILPEGKKLVPLAQNWPFDRGFLLDWLGSKSFESFFHPWYRDTLSSAQLLNDQHWKDPTTPFEWKIPFPKSNLGYLCSCVGVKNAKPHDALQDCIATAEVYRRMVLKQYR
jgi:DNA polymerase III epsilon subunit-like protein